jgi:hypothetical protein
MRAYLERAPLKGAWELLALQVLGALAERRPDLNRADLAALAEGVICAKANSLDADARQAYRDSRRRWESSP